MNTTAFMDGITWSIIDVAKGVDRYATPAIQWYCKTFFGNRADDIYRDLGIILGNVMVLAIMAGMIARQYVQGWVNATVEDCLDTEADILDSDTSAPVLRSAIALRWYAPALSRGFSVALSVVTVAAVGMALLATMAVREVPFMLKRVWA